MKIKNLAFLLIASFITMNINAQQPEELINRFFKSLQDDGIQLALKNITSTNSWLEKDTTTVVKWERKITDLSIGKGEYCGYELIEKIETGSCLVECLYILKYEKAPVRISFVMYKPKESWQLNMIKFSRSRTEGRQRTAKNR